MKSRIVRLTIEVETDWPLAELRALRRRLIIDNCAKDIGTVHSIEARSQGDDAARAVRAAKVGAKARKGGRGKAKR